MHAEVILATEIPTKTPPPSFFGFIASLRNPNLLKFSLKIFPVPCSFERDHRKKFPSWGSLSYNYTLGYCDSANDHDMINMLFAMVETASPCSEALLNTDYTTRLHV